MEAAVSKCVIPPLRRAACCGHFAVAILFALIVLAQLLPINLDSTHSMFVSLAWFTFALQTIQFHVGMILVVTALVLVRRRWRYALVLGLLAALWLAPSLLDFVPRRAAPAGETLRILSLNLREGGYDADTVMVRISAADPDIICFQEYNADGHARLFPCLESAYPHRITAPTTAVRGAAVYSRIPLTVSPGSVFDLGQGGGP